MMDDDFIAILVTTSACALVTECRLGYKARVHCECNTRLCILKVISASRWKRDVGLYGKGKEGSRQLALALFPQAAEHLKCAP
jgi:hypothetical protein